MTAHSRLAPSAADRWVFCPGSVRLSEQYPVLLIDPSAAEGEAAHWVGYSMIRTHSPQVGDVAPNGLVVDAEMIEGGLLWFNTLFEISNGHGGFAAMNLERRVAIASLHPEMFGTPDGDLWIPELRQLHIPDYKFGHRSVDAFENWQLAAYARGRLDELQAQGHNVENAEVFFYVVQPRSYTREGPVRKWSATVEHLESRMWPMLREAAQDALHATNPRFAVGAQCRDCPARRACPTLARNSQAVMDLANHAMPSELQPGELGVELAFLERAQSLLDARIEALHQQAVSMINNGHVVPGKAIGSGRGSKVWREDVPVAEIKILGEMLGVDLLKPAAPVTVTQAAQLFKSKSLDASVIADYSKSVPGAAKLVASSDNLAHRVFQRKHC